MGAAQSRPGQMPGAYPIRSRSASPQPDRSDAAGHVRQRSPQRRRTLTPEPSRQQTSSLAQTPRIEPPRIPITEPIQIQVLEPTQTSTTEPAQISNPAVTLPQASEIMQRRTLAPIPPQILDPTPPRGDVTDRLQVRVGFEGVNPFCRPFVKNTRNNRAWDAAAKWQVASQKAISKDALLREQYNSTSPVLWVRDHWKNPRAVAGHDPRKAKDLLVALDSYVYADLEDGMLASHDALWPAMVPQAQSLDHKKSRGQVLRISKHTRHYFLQVIMKFMEIIDGGIYAWRQATPSQRRAFVMEQWDRAPISFSKLAFPSAAKVIDFENLILSHQEQCELHCEVLKYKISTLSESTWLYRSGRDNESAWKAAYRNHMLPDKGMNEFYARGVDEQGLDLPCFSSHELIHL